MTAGERATGAGRRVARRVGWYSTRVPLHLALLWVLVILCHAGVDVRRVLRDVLAGGLEGGLSPVSAATPTPDPADEEHHGPR